MCHYGVGTKWCPASPSEYPGKSTYDQYSKAGRFVIYISDDETVKVACHETQRDDTTTLSIYGGQSVSCYDQEDREISKEKAAELLGVESLDMILYSNRSINNPWV